MGGYSTNEIFRVDRGFVAQVQGSAAIFAKRNQIASAAVVSRVARGAHAARRTRRTPHTPHTARRTPHAARRTLNAARCTPHLVLVRHRTFLPHSRRLHSVDGGRRAPMSKALRTIAKQNVPDEFSQTLTHARGLLSMGKFEEANSGTSSFSMLLGDAPFLDHKYTIFGRVVAGDFVLSQLETLETVREGIFVKPKVRAAPTPVVLSAPPSETLRLRACARGRDGAVSHPWTALSLRLPLS